jgi:hypothetical protein
MSETYLIQFEYAWWGLHTVKQYHVGDESMEEQTKITRSHNNEIEGKRENMRILLSQY